MFRPHIQSIFQAPSKDNKNRKKGRRSDRCACACNGRGEPSCITLARCFKVTVFRLNVGSPFSRAATMSLFSRMMTTTEGPAPAAMGSPTLSGARGRAGSWCQLNNSSVLTGPRSRPLPLFISKWLIRMTMISEGTLPVQVSICTLKLILIGACITSGSDGFDDNYFSLERAAKAYIKGRSISMRLAPMCCRSDPHLHCIPVPTVDSRSSHAIT